MGVVLVFDSELIRNQKEARISPSAVICSDGGFGQADLQDGSTFVTFDWLKVIM